ncbi:hypothetical protein CNMCM7691_005383 [Aspergillus felis]|uniref:Store-operated calcium entry-associated regulatory factor n=1 Tax=Aspergillus felis TaxID=1287682 RepID=A0A8H6QJT5_9EURO|nr:hypothetical protein CNMCM7691_005383 [Aspergillus felis]
MYYPSINSLLLWLLCFAPPGLAYGRSSESPPGPNAILLSRVQSLTLRANRLTSSRRVSPIPQLKCVGPSKSICDKYKIETMRCTNAGYDYDEEDVQWTCTAPLPEEFMLGATDVICEGYRNADDKWVLKGSCGVEYRLLLTERGERRFGKIQEDDLRSIPRATKGWRRGMDALVHMIFLGFWAAVLVMILWPMVGADLGEEEAEEVAEEMTMGLTLGHLLHTAAFQIVVHVHRSQGGDRAFGPVLRLEARLATRWVGEAIDIATDRHLLEDGMTKSLGGKAAHGRVPLLGFRLPRRVRDSAQQDEDNA